MIELPWGFIIETLVSSQYTTVRVHCWVYAQVFALSANYNGEFIVQLSVHNLKLLFKCIIENFSFIINESVNMMMTGSIWSMLPFNTSKKCLYFILFIPPLVWIHAHKHVVFVSLHGDAIFSVSLDYQFIRRFLLL